MNVQQRSRDHRRRLGVSEIIYLLLDRFTTDEAAPLASPRTCEPGPGTLTLVQTDGQFSISSGVLSFPAQATPAWGDQTAYGVSLSRVVGRALLQTINISTLASGGAVGWFSSTTALGTGTTRSAVLAFNVTAIFPSFNGGAAEVQIPAPLVTATIYQIATILRDTGGFVLIKGGIYTEWTLIWVGDAGTTSPLFPAFSNFNAAGTLDNFRAVDLAAPWTDDYGIATQRLAGSVSAGTPFTHEADCLIEFTVTTVPAPGGIEISFRRQSIGNEWRAVVTSGGALELIERVAGTPTTRATAAGAVSAGQRVVIVATGSTIRGYSNNVLRWTYSSATNFQTETLGVVHGLGTGGVVSDIAAWPRQLSGSALSTLSAV